jgi:hypothetical protein
MGNGIAAPAAPAATRLAGLSPAHLGVVGQVATSWGVAGGLLAAVVVTGHMVVGHLSSSLGFLTTTIFFVAGSLIGFLHGGIVGYLSRPPDVCRVLALKRLALGAFYAVPAMVLGWLFALALALTPVAVTSRRAGLLIPAALGWLALVGVVAWAAHETRIAVPNLFRRWPESRALVVVLGLLFLALLPFFLGSRPEIWLLQVRPTGTAAVFMALGATAWIGGPLATLAFLALRAWRRAHPGAARRR